MAPKKAAKSSHKSKGALLPLRVSYLTARPLTLTAAGDGLPNQARFCTPCVNERGPAVVYFASCLTR